MSKRRRWSAIVEWSLAGAAVTVVLWALIHSLLNH